jgi:hypothetical protein
LLIEGLTAKRKPEVALKGKANVNTVDSKATRPFPHKPTRGKRRKIKGGFEMKMRSSEQMTDASDQETHMNRLQHILHKISSYLLRYASVSSMDPFAEIMELEEKKKEKERKKRKRYSSAAALDMAFPSLGHDLSAIFPCLRVKQPSTSAAYLRNEDPEIKTEDGAAEDLRQTSDLTEHSNPPLHFSVNASTPCYCTSTNTRSCECEPSQVWTAWVQERPFLSRFTHGYTTSFLPTS